MSISKINNKPKVIEALKKHGNISRAAREVGINRRTIAVWRENDPVFKAASDAALLLGRE